MQQLDPYKVVLFDETATRLGITPDWARAPKGERAHSPERRNTGENHTLLSAVSLNGVLPDLLSWTKRHCLLGQNSARLGQSGTFRACLHKDA